LKNSQRIERVNDEIVRTVADIMRFEMSDPRLNNVVSVTGAKTTADLKYCKIYVSVLENTKDEPSELLKALTNAAGFVRKRVAEILNLRHTPEITFVLDDSIAHGMKMNKLIDEITNPTNNAIT